MSQEERSAIATALLLVHALGLVGWLVLARRWVRRFPASRMDFGVAALLALAIAATSRWGVDAPSIPTRWVTAMQEGRAERSILHLYGLGTHAGHNWYGIVSRMQASPVMNAYDVVHMNLSLAALNTVLLAVALRAIVAHRLVAALLTLAWAVSANRVNAACSELPSELLTTYFLMALLPVATFESEAAPRRGATAFVAIANVACWAFLAALTREETLAIGGPAVLAMLFRTATREDVIARKASAFAGWLSARWWAPLLALWVASVLADQLADLVRLHPSSRVRWALQSFQLWRPTRTALPSVLADFLPIPVVVAMVLGLLLALRRPLRTALLPLTVFAVWAVYQKASHDAPYERFRYVSMLTAPLTVLAALGARDAEAWLAARPAWRRPAAWALAVAGVLSVVPGAPGHSVLARHTAVAGEREQGLLLARNKQFAVRHLLEATANHPDCAFVARVSSQPQSTETPPLDRWIFFGYPLARPIVVPARERTIREAIDEAVGEGTCVLYYRSLDCNLLRARGECDADVADAVALERRALVSRPYSDSMEYGELTPVVETGLFRMLVGSQRRPRRPDADAVIGGELRRAAITASTPTPTAARR